MRFVLATLCSLALCTAHVAPSAAQYAERWFASVSLDATHLTPTHFVDFDGDFQLELVVNVNVGGSWHIQVRDPATGAVEFQSPSGNDGFTPWTFSAMDMDPSDSALELLATDGARVLVIDYLGATASPVRGPDLGEALLPARPNPFEGTTALSFSLAAPARADVEVYDVAGRLVRRLGGGRMGAGEQRVDWDGRDQSGRVLGPGTYFYRLSVDGRASEARKAVHLGRP